MNAAPVKHRLTAILAADAVGFSRLMAADDDATVIALDAARGVFRQQVEAQQGRVIDMAGDSVLAVFDTATGAVTAALAIQQNLDAQGGAVAPERRMRFRIGVHLGDLVEKEDGTVYGDGVNVAARLQALADPGGITVSDAVRGVVIGRIDAVFADRGEQRLKNIAAPIHAFAIETAGGIRSIPAAPFQPPEAHTLARRPAGLFVGRRREMAQLDKALAAARAGRGEVVLLAGSGGMGKTRLAQEMAARAARDGVPVLWGRCLEEPGAPPYWPWRQLVRAYLRASGDPDPARTFGAGLPDIAGIIPELGEAFSTATSPQPPELDTAQSRFRLFDAVAGFWRRAAQRVPLVLIFEDLHWADATSLRLFAFLAAELEDSALLVIGSYRDTELSRQHPLFETLAELGRLPVFSRIELSGLSERETGEFIDAASGGNASARLANAIHARTEGHPLFLEETLRFMLDTGGGPQPLEAHEDDLRLLQKIPAGVREVIGKRLNRLSESALRVLSIASCIGRSFELDLLAQIESGKSEDEVLGALEEAMAVQLVEQVPQSQQFRFSHALVRECIYDEMLGLRRARLHLRIGELLEQRFGTEDPTVLPQLAYHFSEAGPGAAQKALACATQSAGRAAQVLAFEEAARLYQLALHLQQQHFAGDVGGRCGLLLSLGEVQSPLGATERTKTLFQEAAQLARKEGLVLQFARAALGYEKNNAAGGRSGAPAVVLLLEAITLHRDDDALRVELLARLCRAYVYCDLADEAREAHRNAVMLARRIGDMSALRVALSAIGSAVYWPEMLRERLAAANEAWGIAGDHEQPLFVAELLPYYLIDLIRVGDVPTLRRLREEGLRLTERTGWVHYRAICNCVEGVVAINEGRFADAERWATQALALGRRVAEEQAMGVYGTQMFCLRREQGRLRETLPLLQHFVRTTPQAQTWIPGLTLLYAELDMRAECEAQYESLPWNRLQAPRDASTMTVIMFTAEVCVYLGDAARAALLYPLLKGHAGANLLADSGGPCLGSADRLLGSLAGVMRQWVVAQRHFEAALTMDEKTGARVWLAHSRYAYAAMLHRRALAGDHELASTLLAAAGEEAAALGMNALVPRIAALAGVLSAPAPALPCGLTEREVGVLRLMAMGRNNRDIGQVLAISPNTVANHVRSILEKTYTSNRTEAAAFARREGLLKE
ncbi:AAA family ATPase [Variovorax sp. J22R133]|uniref:helix-turn-helix transcriptional regulator n=1 Tax=Variovorax brevis TaxID=3053503 RepID=UPI002576004B|nr:AAA family ATPase [Variovorax sp. J22R133]MDM0115419.1 AAA family ATPase [Variovorax sp. J22R133]